ncbi:hypothetical protein SFRURICE_006570 [Spodoptera frugiperda]|nr:hypothetical protein SFRURICE_006570 [Spodoptera frugiperda]
MTEVAHRLSTSKSSDDVTNILHRTYEVCMRINTDRKSRRTTVGQKARQADHLAWSEDPPFLRELYSLFPKVGSAWRAYCPTVVRRDFLSVIKTMYNKIVKLNIYIQADTDKLSQLIVIGERHSASARAPRVLWCERDRAVAPERAMCERDSTSAPDHARPA